MATTIRDFESALAELESLVKSLESGNLTLEKSLALFERGIELSRYCHTRLEDAERRIEVLNERGELEDAPEAVAGPAAPAEADGGASAADDDGEISENDIPF